MLGICSIDQAHADHACDMQIMHATCGPCIILETIYLSYPIEIAIDQQTTPLTWSRYHNLKYIVLLLFKIVSIQPRNCKSCIYFQWTAQYQKYAKLTSKAIHDQRHSKLHTQQYTCTQEIHVHTTYTCRLAGTSNIANYTHSSTRAHKRCTCIQHTRVDLHGKLTLVVTSRSCSGCVINSVTFLLNVINHAQYMYTQIIHAYCN